MKITEEEFLNYYEQGLKDSEIARITGDGESTINQYRHKLGLSPNGRKVITDEEFFEWYDKGYYDAKIASITGASSSQITRRRNKFGLPAHIKISESRQKLIDNFLPLYEDGLSDIEIAKILNIGKSTVQVYRTELKLETNGKKVFRNNQLLEDFNNGLSDEEIANKHNCSVNTVKHRRCKLGLLRRDDCKPIDYKLNPEEYQVVLGSILGDGNLTHKWENGGTILRIGHCIRQKEYIEYKQNLLKNFCSEIKEYTKYDERRKIPEYTDVLIYTRSNLQLNKFYHNWYNPIKHICKEDLYTIEPLGLAIWYMDDGYKCKPYGGCILCTNCFTREDVEIIRDMFKEKFDITVTLNLNHNMVYIPTKEFPKFKKLIEPYIIPSMQYKIKG